MKKVETIQRYAYRGRQNNAVAGAYTATGTLVLTPKFNIILNSVCFTFRSYDSVTSQAIASVADTRLETTIGHDDPAIVPTAADDVNQSWNWASLSNPSDLATYLYMNSGIAYTFRYTYYLTAVTANIITNTYALKLGYLAPKDYLSVEPFDI